jgi:dipeptidase E
VCFLATAGGDSPSYTVKFYNSFSGGHCEPSHLALFNRTVDDARGLAARPGRDLRRRREHREPARAWERGIVLAGLCAGSMCWFEGGVTASFGRRLTTLHDGLGFLPGSNCPHYRHRRDAYAAAVRAGLAPGLAADDGVALHFVDRRLTAVVASGPERRAYRVGVAGGRLFEAPLRPILIDGAGWRARARGNRRQPMAPRRPWPRSSEGPRYFRRKVMRPRLRS